MDKIMEKINKLSLPTTILIASIILGGFYYASQVNKQKSIERQQQIKIEQEKIKEEQLNECLQVINTNPCGEFFGDIAEKYSLCNPKEKIKELKDECFKKYPQK